MADTFPHIIKNIWRINKLGSGMFISGMILFIVGLIYSIIWKENFNSSPDEIGYVVIAIGIGIPFILTGINIILNPVKENLKLTIRERNYLDHCINYIEENKIMSTGLTISIMSIIFFLYHIQRAGIYPQIYIVYIYTTGISLLIIDTFSNTANLREKLEESNRIINQKEKMCKEEVIPDYITEFANNLKKEIDDATNNLSERTVSSIKKYKLDNEQLHNDVQNFKQRIEKEKDESKKYANERIIKNLMKMFHSIDYVLKYKDNKDINNMINDVEGIKKDLNNILKDEEIEIINPSIGEHFDDTKCCAIQSIDTDKFPDNKIVEVKKLGYRFKSGKIICADVAVSKNNNRQKPIVDKDNKDKQIDKYKQEQVEDKNRQEQIKTNKDKKDENDKKDEKDK